MPETLRTFIAVDIAMPQGLREVLGQLRGLGPALKVVDENSGHVTLKFLGDIPVKSLPEIQKAVESAASQSSACEVELVGIGAFPHWGRPAVVWAGLFPKQALCHIAERVETEIERLGLPREDRAFHPHLTLARIKAKPPEELKELAAANEKVSFGTQTIDRVILYQSALQKPGPVYTPLLTARLGGPV